MKHEEALTILIPETGKEALQLEGFGTIEKFLDHAIKKLPGHFSYQYLKMALEIRGYQDNGFDPEVVFEVWKKRYLVEIYKKTFDGHPQIRDDALYEILASSDTTEKMCREYGKTVETETA